MFAGAGLAVFVRTTVPLPTLLMPLGVVMGAGKLLPAPGAAMASGSIIQRGTAAAAAKFAAVIG